VDHNHLSKYILFSFISRSPTIQGTMKSLVWQAYEQSLSCCLRFYLDINNSHLHLGHICSCVGVPH